MSVLPIGESPMQVLVIGAGLGGLAAAISIQSDKYQVNVVESTKELTEVGAGVQITPQTVNVFQDWGIVDQLEPLAAQPKAFTILRYSDGKVLAEDPDWLGWQRQAFGHGVWDLHRADMQQAMYRKALELGVKFRFGTAVETIDFDRGAVTFKSGEVKTADLVVAVDGLHSKARQCMLGRPDPPLPTGDLAYRIVLNEDEVVDPEMRKMLSEPAVRLWAGPKAHAIMYSLKGGKQMNIVLLTPDDLPEDVRRTEGNTDEMMALFEGWDPLLRRYLGLVKSVDKWRLMHHGGLQTWHHPAGRFVMMGDAVHPMLPYLAQGSNSAVEDGVVLGECLKRVTAPQDIAIAVKIFEKIRKPRSEKIVAMTHRQRHCNHLDDGPEQQERDALMAEQMKNGRDADFPSIWINPKDWSFICGYKPREEVAKNWDRLKAEL